MLLQEGFEIVKASQVLVFVMLPRMRHDIEDLYLTVKSFLEVVVPNSFVGSVQFKEDLQHKSYINVFFLVCFDDGILSHFQDDRVCISIAKPCKNLSDYHNHRPYFFSLYDLKAVTWVPQNRSSIEQVTTAKIEVYLIQCVVSIDKITEYLTFPMFLKKSTVELKNHSYSFEVGLYLCCYYKNLQIESSTVLLVVKSTL